MHTSVLLSEVIDGLDLKEGDLVLDGTLGLGGHSRGVCDHIGKTGQIVGLDQDKKAIDQARENLKECPCQVRLEKENFRNLDKVLDNLNIEHIDKAVFDLGFSSMQMDQSGRGFSFLKDEPLLMTLSDSPKTDELTASEIVNNWREESIADIIYGYGEEQFSRRIAKSIVEARKKHLITTTTQLVEIIEKSVPDWYRHKKIHCATKTFQALRIAVNDELGALAEGLKKCFKYLSVGGRMAVISFHSLEDRTVKNFFRDKKKEGLLKLINKRPVTPTREETKVNPRARSSKLRIIEKI